MKLTFWILGLSALVTGTFTQELDLYDALGDDEVTTAKPTDKPKDGPNLDDILKDISEGGEYKPDGGTSGGTSGGHQPDPGHTPHGGADQPQQEAGSGQIAGIVSAVGMALLGAASSYFAYQKKKLCFKIQGGADPESGKSHGTHSEPQVLSNLLNTS